MTRTGTTGAVQLLLAIVGPALLLLAAMGPGLVPEEVALGEEARAVEAALREVDPELVLLGASTMAEAVDAETLGALLEEEEPVRVAKLVEGGTAPAVWYLLAKERLFGGGLRPRVLLVGSSPRWFLHGQADSRVSERVLAEHMGGYDPVLASKAYGREGAHPALHRLSKLRAKARGAILDGLRELSVGLLLGDRRGSLRAQGARLAGPALERVFGGEHAVDMSLHQRVIPIVEEREEQARARRHGGVADSFVPDLVELAHAHGCRVVFVWLPYMEAAHEAESVEPQLLAELVRSLNEAGAGWLDLHDMGYPDAYFRDPAHMAAAGRQRFSADLAAALLELGALGEDPLPAAALPFFLEHSVARRGEPAPLPAPDLRPDPDQDGALRARLPRLAGWSNHGATVAGLGPVSPLVVIEDGEALDRVAWGRLDEAGSASHASALLQLLPRDPAHWTAPEGHFTLRYSEELPLRSGRREAWWVYPGTELEVVVEGEGDSGSELSLRLQLEPMAVEAPAPTLEVDGRAVELTWRRERMEASSTFAPPERPWSIVIAAPREGPPVAVRWLALERDGARLDLLGSPELAAPPEVDALLLARRGEAEVRGLVEPIPLEPGPAHPRLPLTWVLLPEGPWEELSNEALTQRAKRSACSPLRLRWPGEEPTRPAATCAKLQQLEPSAGAFCQQGDRLLLADPDGALAEGERRLPELLLAPDRAAPFGFWVAPGDRSELPIGRPQAALLRHGASSLLLEGLVLEGDPEAELGVRLISGGELVHEGRLPVRRLREGTVTIDLDPPLQPRSTTALQLASGPEAPFVMLTRAVLRE
jgi:hypothetical protein